MMNVNDSFVVLDEEFPLHVLEHELGHLAWAMHERTDTKHADFWVNEQVFPNNRDKVKLCGWLFLLGFWNRDDLF
ncbi:hypothetical protein JCM19239_2727 [Vibrio variabilis]|uniref:Peptidase M48 domain-containing protein n=1 Tax=Vibrio variabilis TaxID=990271 RepID=A0ABQ0JQP8_9VIBR|nr:hypothetical protein JCM19239_2727 [Vibrio variabilis]